MDYKDATNTSVIKGTFDVGAFTTLNAQGQTQTESSNIAQTELFLPSVGNLTPGGFGVVSAGDTNNAKSSPSSSQMQDLADETGVPTLLVTFASSVPHAFGYSGLNGLSAVTMEAMPAHNPCHLDGTVHDALNFGNFNAMLARMNLMGMTVLQRLVAREMGSSAEPVTKIAVSGSSKTGASAWATAVTDTRVKAVAAMHNQAQNLSSYLEVTLKIPISLPHLT
jgi:hypothetical protein